MGTCISHSTNRHIVGCSSQILIMKLLIVLSVCLVAAFAEKCAISCPKIYRPACGSDLNTYGNMCLMKLASCMAGKAIIPIYNGKCKAEESCQISCPKNYRPVCGSDGTTYANFCTVRQTACKTKTAIIPINKGK